MAALARLPGLRQILQPVSATRPSLVPENTPVRRTQPSPRGLLNDHPQVGRPDPVDLEEAESFSMSTQRKRSQQAQRGCEQHEIISSARMGCMTRARRSHFDWYIVIMLLLLTLAVVVALGGGKALTKRSPSAGGLPAPASASLSTPPATVPSQPGVDGYEYRITEERYVVQQQTGQFEVQNRRRESWRASDGWSWARQTGSDPGRFIFSPNVDWKPIRAAKPDARDMTQVMRRTLAAVPASEFLSAEFNCVNDLLGSETLPPESLPAEYRRAIIAALANNDGVEVRLHVLDPNGRNSTRVRLSNPKFSISLYFDRDDRYLAYAASAVGSEERASRIVTERRQVSQIPQDLLQAVGSERVEKAIWD